MTHAGRAIVLLTVLIFLAGPGAAAGQGYNSKVRKNSANSTKTEAAVMFYGLGAMIMAGSTMRVGFGQDSTTISGYSGGEYHSYEITDSDSPSRLRISFTNPFRSKHRKRAFSVGTALVLSGVMLNLLDIAYSKDTPLQVEAAPDRLVVGWTIR